MAALRRSGPILPPVSRVLPRLPPPSVFSARSPHFLVFFISPLFLFVFLCALLHLVSQFSTLVCYFLHLLLASSLFFSSFSSFLR